MPYLAATDRISYWQSLAIVLIRILLRIGLPRFKMASRGYYG